jgi:Holliday junction resolvase RusA-like endonuclease
MRPLSIEIPGPVVPKERPRVVRRRDGSGNVYTFTPPRTKTFEKTVAWHAAAALQEWIDLEEMAWPAHRRMALKLYFFMGDERARDLDNCVKSVTDALNKIVFDDDKQIDELYARREFDKKSPRTVIVVKAL